jgi:hypothetical protein
MTCPHCSKQLKLSRFITPMSIQWCDEHKFIAVIPSMQMFADTFNKALEEGVLA